MDKKKLQMIIALVVLIGGAAGGLWYMKKQADAGEVCPYCKKTFPNIGLHQVSCDQNPTDLRFGSEGKRQPKWKR